MMQRYIDAHEPALSHAEAAMLPAIGKAGKPGRLLMPRDETVFRPVENVQPAPQETPACRGSMAGPAVLGRITLPGVGRMRSGKRPRPAPAVVEVKPAACCRCRW